MESWLPLWTDDLPPVLGVRLDREALLCWQIDLAIAADCFCPSTQDLHKLFWFNYKKLIYDAAGEESGEGQWKSCEHLSRLQHLTLNGFHGINPLEPTSLEELPLKEKEFCTILHMAVHAPASRVLWRLIYIVVLCWLAPSALCPLGSLPEDRRFKNPSPWLWLSFMSLRTQRSLGIGFHTPQSQHDSDCHSCLPAHNIPLFSFHTFQSQGHWCLPFLPCLKWLSRINLHRLFVWFCFSSKTVSRAPNIGAFAIFTTLPSEVWNRIWNRQSLSGWVNPFKAWPMCHLCLNDFVFWLSFCHTYTYTCIWHKRNIFIYLCIYFYFMSMSGFLVCMYVHHWHVWFLQRSEELLDEMIT